MQSKDLYKIFGLERNASQEEIKKKFLKLAKELHPDNKETGSEEKFKEMHNAYEILSDPDKRMEYDQGGIRRVSNNNPFFGQGNRGRPFNIWSMFTDDLFTNKQKIQQKNISITLEEAFSGCQKKATYSFETECSECKTKNFSTCKKCNGSGIIPNNIQHVQNGINTAYACFVCNQRGEVRIKACNLCNNREIVEFQDTLLLNIPKGAQTGTSVIANIKNGVKVKIIIEIQKHPRFQLAGEDLISSIDINILELIAGTKRDIVAIDGQKIEVKIPPHKHLNTSLKCKGQGFINGSRMTRGDLIIRLNPIIPELPDEKMRILKSLID